MKILFLHGWQSTPGGVKPSYLARYGHEILNPALPDDDFDAAVRIAQADFDQCQPDVIVGSSRGGAVAMNIDSGDTPVVLLCPAWKMWGTATTVKANTTILHSRADEMNIGTSDTPLVLLCPAWKRWGTATTVKPGTTILHSRADENVPFADSEVLASRQARCVRRCSLPGAS